MTPEFNMDLQIENEHRQGRLPWEDKLACEPEKKQYTRKRANKLDGRKWLRYSVSIWGDIRKSPEEVALGHPAIFPVSLVTRLLECYTTDEEKIILDPFVGVGSTVVAAHRMGKTGIGIDTSPKFVEKGTARLGSVFSESGNLTKDTGSKIMCNDANNLLEIVAPDSVDMVITSPPYWDVLTQKRTADYKEVRHYGYEEADLGRIEDYELFLAKLKTVFEKVFIALKEKNYCCVVVMDLRKGDKFYPYHSDVADFMRDIGFVYDDLIIWDRRAEYSNFRPLGFPSRFRINKAHEFILVFRKPLEKGKCPTS